MIKIVTYLLFVFSASAILAARGRAQTVNAASCNSGDVQAAINSAIEGGTVIIPPGVCTWTSGVSISGKGVIVKGAGSGRIVARATTSSPLPLTTGSVTVTLSSNNIAGTLPSLTVGQTVNLIELGVLANFLKGPITAYNQSTGALTINATSAGGTCGTNTGQGLISNCERFMVSTSPSVSETVLINAVNAPVNTTATMFSITEDTSVNTTISGIHFSDNNAQTNGEDIVVWRNGATGQAVLIHDNMFQWGFPEIIDLHTNRGVIWNNSFLGNPFTGSGDGIRIQDISGNLGPYSWTSTSTMGTNDIQTANAQAGQNNVYVETNDFEAIGQTTDVDSGSRMVWRYNYQNNSWGSSHGADTGPYGMRHFEFYNNIGHWDSFGCDASTVAPGNGWMLWRGGTGVWYNNTLDSLVGCAWGSKSDIKFIIENLQRNAGPNPCWGANYSTAGQYYHVPRQVGFGRVMATGVSNYPSDGVNNASIDSVTYVGDSEPVYIWNNNRSMSVGIADYGSTGGCSGTSDSSANYIVLNRDYYNGSTAKPGWSPYTYPHPLTEGTQSSSPVAAPTNLLVTVN